MEVIRILAHCRKKVGTAEVALTGVTDIPRVNEGAVVRETSLTGATRVTYGIIGNRETGVK